MLQFFAKRLAELHERERDERGFTLIELLIVVIIIGILAAIAIPTFLAQREKAQIATCKSDTRNAAEAAVLYAADTDEGNFAGINLDGLEANGFNQTEGYGPTTATELDGGNGVEIETDCSTAPGTASWTTEDVDSRGEVVYSGDPPPAP